MLKHETRSEITAGNKVIHNFFSVDLAVFVYEKQRKSCHSFISNRRSSIGFKTSHGAETALTSSSWYRKSA